MMDAQEIFSYLKSCGYSDEGAVAIIANLHCESALIPNNLQNTYNTKFGITDEDYTKEVDEGKRNFADSAGYGLAQWTYHARKAELLKHAKVRAKSIGDGLTQLEFLVKELRTDFSQLNANLMNGNDLELLTARFMKEFEKPADITQKAVNVRVDVAKRFYPTLTSTTFVPQREITIKVRKDEEVVIKIVGV